MPGADYAVGIDIGGTHISGVRIDGNMHVVRKAKIPVPAKKDKNLMTSLLFRCLDELCKNGGDNKLAGKLNYKLAHKLIGIGAAVPGVIKGGVVERSPNLPFFNKTDFKSLISRRFKARVVVDNDVNCMAFGESVNREEKNIVALTLGTGIGGGLVIDGKLYRGRCFAGELGHMVIKFDGSRCACGNLGCFEEYASARSVRRLSAKVLGKRLEPHEVDRLIKNGNKRAKKVWTEYGKMLGVGLTNFCYILDPDLIVLGGGISKAYIYFKDSMLAEMKKRVFIPLPKIVTGKQNANAYGAACLALKSRKA
jgi:glucokinase